MKFSIVILYYNRENDLLRLIEKLSKIDQSNIEIIIVDNNSCVNLYRKIRNYNSKVKYIRLDNNLGAVGRNKGIEQANGDIIICLDDDIIGITDKDLSLLESCFNKTEVAAVCFKVINPSTAKIMNWCHHCDPNVYSDVSFITNEISEGAVAFRSSVLKQVGLYPEYFFISHEGPDLACRIINNGYRIIYVPEIVVKHFHSDLGRTSWRRYYYDTRNVIWLSVRNFPPWYGLKKVFWGVVSMMIYAVRDGFFRYWAKGLFDALIQLGPVLKERDVLTKSALDTIKAIEKNRLGFFELVKRRLFRRDVRI